jgi:hypothetical protein
MLDAGCSIRPPTQICPQMTQIDADPHKENYLRDLRDLREGLSSLEARKGLHGRNDLLFGDVRKPVSRIWDRAVGWVIPNSSFLIPHSA